jgi:predicted PurR-regulated permease PerM
MSWTVSETISLIPSILFKLKKYNFVLLSTTLLIFFLLPSTKIWIASAACVNEKFTDPCSRALHECHYSFASLLRTMVLFMRKVYEK